MNLEKKLEDWVSKSLISREQANAIRSHEKGSSPNLFTYTFLTLGVSIVTLGILAFIAANWENIPGSIKIIFDFLILIIVAFFIVYFEQTGKPLIRDRWIVFFQLFILASIGLISQVFHTSGKFYEALFLWTVITLPIVLVAENKFPSHMYLLTVYGTFFLFFIDHFQMHKRSVIFVVQLQVPSIYLITGVVLQQVNVASLQRFGFTSIFWGTVSIVVGTFSFHFLDKFDNDSNIYLISILIYSFSSIMLTFLAFKTNKVASILILFLSIFYLGVHVSYMKNGSTELWDAVFFIGIWLFLGLLFLSLRYNRLFEAAIVVVGIRFLVVYFQIFESLLMTSLGLVLSGIFIVTFVLFYMKYKEKIYYSLEKYL